MVRKMDQINELDVLALRYGTDKSTGPSCHWYTPIYDFLFRDKRFEINNIM